MLRAVVIGCGAIGAGSAEAPHPDVGVATHAEAYAACPETELVAVCDADGARADRAARRFGVPRYDDAVTLLAEVAPDLVSVCTPDATHAEVVAHALKAPGPRAVLAEKPLALDSPSARALATMARERGVALAVNYSRRFVPAFRALRDRIGTLGDLQHVSGFYVKGLLHNGTHWLDLLRFLAGEPVAVRGWDRLEEKGPDPSLDAELTLPGGVGARLAALDTHQFTAFEMDLVGTRGRARVADSGHVLQAWVIGDDPRHAGYRALRPQPAALRALHDAMLHAVADLARCATVGGEPACGGEDGAAAIALAEGIRASAARGGEIVTLR